MNFHEPRSIQSLPNLVVLPLLLLVLLGLLGCPGDNRHDAGAEEVNDGGLFRAFTPPASASVPNSILVTTTGEAAATEGTSFPPASGTGAPYFVDGWQVTFEAVLVTVGTISVSENPDLDPNDPSRTGGLVAKLDGPWVVDLAKPGALDAKEQNGSAVALARFTNQNEKSGRPAFSPTEKYAFGFDLIAARSNVYNVNLDANGELAYREMLAKGHSVWMKGTAEWRGSSGVPACRTSNADFDFNRFPKKLAFAFGFVAPVTYLNCQNPELQPSGSRGLQTKTNDEIRAQLTFHLDHPFWEALEEDSPLRFDALAARRTTSSDGGVALAHLTMDDFSGLDFQAMRDAQSQLVPWRTCGPALPNERSQGYLRYEPVSVPVNPAGGLSGLKDLVDYMTFNLSTFGHLNNDGLCFPHRNFPAPH
jgi:hypothetical protein